MLWRKIIFKGGGSRKYTPLADLINNLLRARDEAAERRSTNRTAHGFATLITINIFKLQIYFNEGLKCCAMCYTLLEILNENYK